MIAFPHGFYFGRVEPAGGVGIAAGYLGGRVDLEHLRGRCCLPIDVQAAEHLLRGARDLTGVDDAAVDDVVRMDTTTVATFRTPLGRFRVAVRRTLGPPEQLTCHSETMERPPRFELLEDIAVAP